MGFFKHVFLYATLQLKLFKGSLQVSITVYKQYTERATDIKNTILNTVTRE